MTLATASACIQTMRKIGDVLLIDVTGPYGAREAAQVSAKIAQFVCAGSFCLRLDAALVTLSLKDAYELEAARMPALPGALVVNEVTEPLARHYALLAAEAGIVRGVFTDYAQAMVFAARQGWVYRQTMAGC